MEFSKNNKNCDSLPNKARNDTGDQQPQERDLMNKDAPNSLESESQRCISSYFEKIFFPTMLVFGIYELAEYIGKISGDSHATKKYFVSGEFHLFVISLTCLLLPVITYTVYRVFEAFARGGDSFSHIPEEISGVSHNDEKFNKVCTLILHGLLIIPWQIRKHVEVLNFVVPRVCPFRAPNKKEKKTANELERNALVLQFFLDFYSGFVQVVLQLYILVSYFDGKIDFNTLSTWELVASVLSVKTLLCAVKRKDDGVLSSILSYLGWGSIFISRAVVFALATSVIYYGILGFSIIHALLFSVWISTLVWKSHEIGTSENPTPSLLSRQRKMYYFILVFFLFGLPSLIYWPYMFQLRESRRFVIYIVVIVLENAGLYAIWFFIHGSFSWSSQQLYSTIIVGGCTVLGVIFLACYCCWKPSLTDRIVFIDKRADNITDFGIYFDFFDAVFNLKVDKRDEALLTEIRNNRNEDDSVAAI